MIRFFFSLLILCFITVFFSGCKKSIEEESIALSDDVHITLKNEDAIPDTGPFGKVKIVWKADSQGYEMHAFFQREIEKQFVLSQVPEKLILYFTHNPQNIYIKLLDKTGMMVPGKGNGHENTDKKWPFQFEFIPDSPFKEKHYYTIQLEDPSKQAKDAFTFHLE